MVYSTRIEDQESKATTMNKRNSRPFNDKSHMLIDWTTKKLTRYRKVLNHRVRVAKSYSYYDKKNLLGIEYELSQRHE